MTLSWRPPLMLIVALAAMAVDQASKLAVVWGLDLFSRGEIDVLPPLLVFRMAWNEGMNFGLFSGSSIWARLILITIAVAISVAVYLWVRREQGGPWMQVAAGLLIGGALGNVIDRVAYGAVADFLNMSCCGIENPFAFNIADIAVFMGAIGLVFVTNTPPKSGAKPPKPKPRRKTP